ncbi:molybdenum cofactor guanylyltransferase [Desertibacillus haloalkaliphilus]|uniref:molybdenum cofactor guanylyltransferase n=1 Tax=Desertibacillus haloalkaliphilus TaxID=1328930 RepID=UPI001C27FD13|nr:molybdenum cofactor guanylyltransferase [Desertibacillus haloalkaliphilus]MBU8905028.1 molybdenum cofactor guanylyltransferase [Desertibacillus haloalkaliphilus]
MKTDHNITGVVLAGGQSRRYGSPKAFATFQNKPFYQWAVEALTPHTEKVIVISHPTLTRRLQDIGNYETIEDDSAVKGQGPLAGIYSAMCHHSSEWYMVLPCDTPLIDEKIVGVLCAHAVQGKNSDAVVPTAAGKTQPLVAIYNRRCLPIIEKLLADGQLRMMDLLSKIKVEHIRRDEIGTSDQAFININKKQDWEKLQ